MLRWWGAERIEPDPRSPGGVAREVLPPAGAARPAAVAEQLDFRSRMRAAERARPYHEIAADAAAVFAGIDRGEADTGSRGST